MKIFRVIGEQILALKIECSNFSLKELELLNMMPNLKKLQIFSYYRFYSDFEIPKSFHLKLYNLREINVEYDIENILDIFDSLPVNSLRKLYLNVRFDRKKYFGNQQKIEEIKTKSIEILNIENTKATTFLDAKFNSQKELDQVCRQFKSLEIIHFDCDAFIDLSPLRNLKNLRKFVFPSNFSDFNNINDTLKSASLESLEIATFSKQSRLKVSANCPNLREIKLLHTVVQIGRAHV